MDIVDSLDSLAYPFGYTLSVARQSTVYTYSSHYNSALNICSETPTVADVLTFPTFLRAPTLSRPELRHEARPIPDALGAHSRHPRRPLDAVSDSAALSELPPPLTFDNRARSALVLS